MANPNIVSVTSILGKTDYLIPAGTTALVLLPNAASSGNVLKINQIVAANVDGAPPKGFKLTSTSHKHGEPIGQECIAYKQDNECRDCRACWDSEVQNISYKNH